MAHINNQSLDLFALDTVQDLDNETAATCSGGEGFLSAPEGADVILYKDFDGQGLSLGANAATSDGVSNIGFLNGPQESTFNDTVSSIRVVRGRWSFFQDANYGGDNTGPLGPGLYNLGHNNDKITSAFRNAA
jgi:hypothetical protein